MCKSVTYFPPINRKAACIFLETTEFGMEFESRRLHAGEFTDPFVPGVILVVLKMWWRMWGWNLLSHCVTPLFCELNLCVWSGWVRKHLLSFVCLCIWGAGVVGESGNICFHTLLTHALLFLSCSFDISLIISLFFFSYGSNLILTGSWFL